MQCDVAARFGRRRVCIRGREGRRRSALQVVLEVVGTTLPSASASRPTKRGDCATLCEPRNASQRRGLIFFSFGIRSEAGTLSIHMVPNTVQLFFNRELHGSNQYFDISAINE